MKYITYKCKMPVEECLLYVWERIRREKREERRERREEAAANTCIVLTGSGENNAHCENVFSTCHIQFPPLESVSIGVIAGSTVPINRCVRCV